MKNDKLSFVWDEDEKESYPKYESEDFVVETPSEEEVEYYSDDVDDEEPTKSNRIRIILLIAIIFVISLYFVPIFKVEQVKTNETSFITKDKLMKSLEVEEGQRYSLYKMNQLKNNLDSDSVSASNSHYEFQERALIVEVNEIKPLAQNEAGTLYYSQEDEIKSTTEMSYYVPKLSGFTEEAEQTILDELKQLDYNIIKEMTIIINADIEGRPDLIYIQMKDGNYVEIGINQIYAKMQYYMQLKKIIQEKYGDENGILHLNIGDYYEPI